MFDTLLQEFGDPKDQKAPVEIVQQVDRPVPLSIIRPQPHKKLPYHKLKCSDQDKAIIFTVVSTTANENILWLFAHKEKMNRMGDSITHVHPLKFLEVVFSDPNLKSCMISISEDTLKWWYYRSNLISQLKAKYETNELLRHVKPFSRELTLAENAVRSFLEKKDWDGFFTYLMQSN